MYESAVQIGILASFDAPLARILHAAQILEFQNPDSILELSTIKSEAKNLLKKVDLLQLIVGQNKTFQMQPTSLLGVIHQAYILLDNPTQPQLTSRTGQGILISTDPLAATILVQNLLALGNSLQVQKGSSSATISVKGVSRIPAAMLTKMIQKSKFSVQSAQLIGINTLAEKLGAKLSLRQSGVKIRYSLSFNISNQATLF